MATSISTSGQSHADSRRRAPLESDAPVASRVAQRDDVAVASLLRDEWFALVAHDLRTPLNLVLITAELLQDSTLSEEARRHWLSVIRNAAERMTALIADLLDASRLESGPTMLDIRGHPLRPLLLEAIYGLQPVADRAGVRLTIGTCPADLFGAMDRAAMLRVLTNLVDNAIRFTPAGGLVVIDANRIAASIRFTVSDTGVGIRPEHLPHIFDRFWQAGHARRGSAGLGLTIVKALVEQHGGSVTVESEPGRGTLFGFMVPERPPS